MGGAAQWVARTEPYGFFIVMALVVAGVVGTYWLMPLMQFGYALIQWLITPLVALLH